MFYVDSITKYSHTTSYIFTQQHDLLECVVYNIPEIKKIRYKFQFSKLNLLAVTLCQQFLVNRALINDVSEDEPNYLKTLVW